MGKKAAHTGDSPKDRSINMMDKFITRSNNREKQQPFQTKRRKSNDIPINLWPLKDQLEYWENRTDADRFDDKFPTYSHWIKQVQKKTGVHPSTFLDFTRKHKPMLEELFSKKTDVRTTASELGKLGVF
jgi:hypothetical protein